MILAIADPCYSWRTTFLRNKKKILVIATELDFGGVESSILDRALAFRRVDTNLEFEFACLNKLGKIGRELEESGFTVHDLKSNPKIQNVIATWRVAKLIRSREPALVHSLCIEANYHSVAAARFLRSVSTLAEEVGVPLDPFGQSTRSARARKIAAWIWRRADNILAVSDATKKYIVEIENAAAEKVKVIRHFILTDRFGSDPPSNGRNRNAKLIIGCVGRLSPEKGQSVLLEAASYLDKGGLDVEVWLVGDGPTKQELELAAERMGIFDKVRFLGMRRDIPELLSKMDIFVLPSHHEALGIAILEAQAARVPVIASNVGGVPEVVSDGETGFLVPPNDPQALAAEILKVLDLDNESVSKIVASARQGIEDLFSEERIVMQLDALYQEIL